MINKWVNKHELMEELRGGARIISHDLRHWLVKRNGDHARIRYNVWNSLSKGLPNRSIIVLADKEMRLPDRLPFYVYKLRDGTPNATETAKIN